MPTREQLLHWARGYVALWNEGDKDAWVENWRTVLSGDVRMLDPVGTPEKKGFQECCLDAWDLFQPRVRFRIPPGQLFICDNEVAWLLENHITTDGKESLAYSIETYRFEPDGSVLIRTYYRVPDHSAGELGEMFQTYLPEGG